MADILPDKSTVSRKVQCFKDECIASMQEEFSLLLLGKSGIGFTSDLWTDRVRSVSYTGVTVHYIDDKFVLRKRVAGAN